MTAWQLPRLDKEAKLVLTDDVAGLFLTFGYQTLETAIDFLRQRAEPRRPAIGKIREQCEIEKPQKKASKADLEMEQYHRELRLHPEHFLPVDTFLQVAMQVGEIRKMRANTPNPMSTADYKLECNRRLEIEWAKWGDRVQQARMNGELR